MVNCREDLWIWNQPTVGKKTSETWSCRNEENSCEWKISHKRLHTVTCLFPFVSLAGLRLCCSTRLFTFFSVYRFLLFLHPLPPISHICVWVKAGHSGKEIWVPPSSSPLNSHLLFMSVNVLFYLMYICQQNAGPSSRQSHFPLPSWDIPGLNSVSLHS